MYGCIKSEYELHGLITPVAKLSGSINQIAKLSGMINIEATLSGKMSFVEGYQDYVGEYEITPKAFSQTISTDDKHLTKDVYVREIPYYEVDNTSSGQTVIIGG